MGYSTRPGNLGHTIRAFWPDDTDTELYIHAEGQTLQDLLDAAQEKWPGTKLEDISIAAEHIHTDCLGYDSYDPIDWTNFFLLTRK